MNADLIAALERLGNGVLRDAEHAVGISVALAFRILAGELKEPGANDWHALFQVPKND